MAVVDGVEVIETDFVVVGGGGAGLAAASEAARLGLKVVVLEKAPALGGTTALSVGSIMAAESDQQRRAGIRDTPAAHAKDLDDIRRSMGFDDDTELRKLLTENVADSVRFLASIGINFLGPLPQPPHTASRLHQVMPTSRAYIFRLERHCRSLGVEIRVGIRVTSLLVDGGRVNGVEARNDGRTIRFMGRAGVLLSSGDIGGNEAMMHDYMKNWVDGIEVYNPVNTGDGHRMAEAIGARIVARKDLGAEVAAHIRFVRPRPSLLQRVPPYPWLTGFMVWAMKALPPSLIRPMVMRFLTTTLGPDRGVYEQGAILVNKLGDRFVDETRGPNLHIPKQPDGLAYIVFDNRFAKKFSKFPYFISTAPGVGFAYVDEYRRARPDLFHEGGDLAVLAAKLGVPAGHLRASVEAVNAGRRDELKLIEPPFIALGPVKLWVLVAPVGLAVNTRLEVLTETGEPIPGLYAAGSAGQAGFTVTGHGHGLGWAFTSGRLAARNAAARMRN
jgi:succinate dehydrogenase/fumarate reductase flavoprotein subunit